MTEVNLLAKLKEVLDPKAFTHAKETVEKMMLTRAGANVTQNETVIIYARASMNSIQKFVLKKAVEAKLLLEFIEEHEHLPNVSRIPCGPMIIPADIRIVYEDPLAAD